MFVVVSRIAYSVEDEFVSLFILTFKDSVDLETVSIPSGATAPVYTVIESLYAVSVPLAFLAFILNWYSEFGTSPMATSEVVCTHSFIPESQLVLRQSMYTPEFPSVRFATFPIVKEILFVDTVSAEIVGTDANVYIFNDCEFTVSTL